jgi:hypothetical protein
LKAALRGLQDVGPELYAALVRLVWAAKDLVNHQIDTRLLTGTTDPLHPFVEYADSLLRPALVDLDEFLDQEERAFGRTPAARPEGAS